MSVTVVGLITSTATASGQPLQVAFSNKSLKWRVAVALKTMLLPDCYKIKLRSSGYRSVYQVIDLDAVVFVVAVDSEGDIRFTGKLVSG